MAIYFAGSPYSFTTRCLYLSGSVSSSMYIFPLLPPVQFARRLPRSFICRKFSAVMIPGISSWLTYQELIPGIMTAENFRQMKLRGSLRANCTGGNRGKIYIELDTLPDKYKHLVVKEYGEPAKYIAIQPLKELLHTDDVARRWYAEYVLPCGKAVPLPYQVKYARSCD